jgi:hypothetical protein
MISVELMLALKNPIWVDHRIGDEYTMDGRPDHWRIAYYPIMKDGKTGEKYNEPRALIEKPMEGGGIDFREIPLRYLKKITGGRRAEQHNT